MTNFYPHQFASAYIQTLPHAKKLEEFNNRSDYQEYLNKRRQFYFRQYIEAIEFADSSGKSLNETDNG
ncbi:TPA: hypothetical protein PI328_000354 [Staphylococcus aureus]|nr:hypothetical protein [Staphylococcus aureus]HDH4746406.1 hypothetical protein [Staphylococcus aureus]HDH4759916.1 hypothetical protein [Staphylococcus aureus]HDH4800494.1 hypothetical protein [Staphylococcus aureus]HDH4803045.1 hypothetical protein [Staphylococcus aureus]